MVVGDTKQKLKFNQGFAVVIEIDICLIKLENGDYSNSKPRVFS